MTTTETMTTEPITAQRAFEVMCEAFQKAKREDQLKVATHLRAATNKPHLQLYHNDKNISDDDKVAMYRLCYNALTSGDFSALKGSVPTGDARRAVDPVDAAVKAEVVKTKTATARTTTVEPPPDETMAPPAREVKPPQKMDIAAALKLLQDSITGSAQAPDEAAIKRIAQEQVMIFARSFKPPTPPLDEDEIRRIVDKAMSNGSFPEKKVEEVVTRLAASADIGKQVDDMLALKLVDVFKRLPAASAKPASTKAEPVIGAVYHPKVDPTYVISKETRALLKSIHAESKSHPVNLLVVGPHGCGKTSLPEQMAAEFKMPILIMDCANIREARDWFGAKYTEHGTVYWRTSQFDRAVSAGGHIIVIDEIGRSTDQIRNTLFPLLDDRRFTYLEEKEGVIKVGPGTIFVATLNEGLAYTGSSALDLALADRFVDRIEVNYLSPSDEANVLQSRTGIGEEDAKKLADLAEAIRRKAVGFGATLTKSISTRQLIKAAARLKAMGVEGLTYTLSNHFCAEGGDSSERAQVLQMIPLKFPRL